MKGHASHSNDRSDRRETNLIPATADHPWLHQNGREKWSSGVGQSSVKLNMSRRNDAPFFAVTPHSSYVHRTLTLLTKLPAQSLKELSWITVNLDWNDFLCLNAEVHQDMLCYIHWDKTNGLQNDMTSMRQREDRATLWVSTLHIAINLPCHM